MCIYIDERAWRAKERWRDKDQGGGERDQGGRERGEGGRRREGEREEGSGRAGGRERDSSTMIFLQEKIHKSYSQPIRTPIVTNLNVLEH